MPSKSKISFYIILVSIFSVIAVFTLIVQASYNKVIESQKESINLSVGTSFNPRLDLSVFEMINSRETIPLTIVPNHEPKANYSVGTSTIIPSPIASPSASP